VNGDKRRLTDDQKNHQAVSRFVQNAFVHVCGAHLNGYMNSRASGMNDAGLRLRPCARSKWAFS
jgi:hypothetical protein